MSDQAHDLRRLAMERGRPEAVRAAGRPTLLVVTGGKGGVGTTTIALDLAVALAQAGRRTLLVDADPGGGDAALRCGIEERYTLADLLAGRRTWHEVIETAPSGVQLVAGARWSDEFGDRSPAAAERLLELLGDSSLRADVAVIDVGNGPGRAGQRISQAADAIVMVTTGEPAAVIGTFAAIKSLARFVGDQGGAGVAGSIVPLHLLVNLARTVRDAETVRYRLTRACRRLLGIEILTVGGDSSRRWGRVSNGWDILIGDWSRLLHIWSRLLHIEPTSGDCQQEKRETLNLRPSPADTVRELWARELLLN